MVVILFLYSFSVLLLAFSFLPHRYFIIPLSYYHYPTLGTLWLLPWVFSPLLVCVHWLSVCRSRPLVIQLDANTVMNNQNTVCVPPSVYLTSSLAADDIRLEVML